MKNMSSRHCFTQLTPCIAQIFTLMKQDSFPRFLKSDLYKQCIIAEMENLPLPYTGEEAEPQGPAAVSHKPASESKKVPGKSMDVLRVLFAMVTSLV